MCACDDKRNARDVVDRAQVIEPGNRADSDMVERAEGEEQHTEDDEVVTRDVLKPQQRHHELGAAIVDPGHCSHEADQIQPGGEPADS